MLCHKLCKISNIEVQQSLEDGKETLTVTQMKKASSNAFYKVQNSNISLIYTQHIFQIG